MNAVILNIVRECGAYGCIECGKCSAACSMASMYPDFSGDSSPRGMVGHTLRQAMGQGGGVDEAHLWRCLQCGNCSAACPEQVDCARLIAMLRALAVAGGRGTERRLCAGCGKELPSVPVRRWLDALDPDASPREVADADETGTAGGPAVRDLCPVCRRQVYAANNAAG